jgi:CHAT domain-containing protein
MLTTDYDGWLANVVQVHWAAGNDAFAEELQRIRFTLTLCRQEGDLVDGLRQMDLEYPPTWRNRLASLSPFEGREAEAAVVARAELLETWLAEPDADMLSPYLRSTLEKSVGELWSELVRTRPGVEPIDAALSHYEAALEASPPLDCLYAELFASAAMMQNKRYDRTHSLRDLDLTVANAEQGIAAALFGQLHLDDFHAVWAAGLRNVGQLTGDALYWWSAASAFDQAAALSRPTDARRAYYLESTGLCRQNAGIAPLRDSLPFGLRGSSTVEMERAMMRDPTLRERVTIVAKNDRELPTDEVPDDLAKTVAAAESRLELQEQGSLGEARQWLTLAQVLLARFREEGDDGDLQRAARLVDQAAARLTGEDQTTLHRVRVAVLTAEGVPRNEVAAALTSGMRAGREHPSLTGLDLARECAAHAVVDEDWTLAAEAYDAAGQIHEVLVQRQVGRGYQEMVLELGPALGSLAAVAYAHLGDAERAVVVLERGRAQLMSTVLRRAAADLERVRSLGAEDLADGYVSALLRLDSAASHEDADVVAARAQQDLEAIVDRIRELPGLSEFLRPLDPAGLCSVARDAAASVLYVVETDIGGAIVAVDDGAVHSRLVPGLMHADARRHAEAVAGAAPGSPAHSAALDRAGEWLGEHLAPVLSELSLRSRLVLVPCGVLSVLPLVAARDVEAGGRPVYPFDAFEVLHSPNIQALEACLRLVVPPAEWRTATVVFDPADVPADPLPFADVEALTSGEALRGMGVAVESLTKAAATVGAIVSAIASTDVVHLACHASVDPAEPLSGGLLLAGNRQLTLGQVLQSDVGARLVVLSACETAVTGRRLPDEAVSLPSGLVEAGCGAVIGSLWTVDDETAALLMIALYEGLSRGERPSVALGVAGRRLRDATNAELVVWLKPTLAAAPSAGARTLLRQLMLAEPDERPFSSPARWAAFVYVGA